MHFLVSRGHGRLIPPTGSDNFPEVVLNGKRLDLFNLYREVCRTFSSRYLLQGIQFRLVPLVYSNWSMKIGAFAGKMICRKFCVEF
jgi:hypothetical protein